MFLYALTYHQVMPEFLEFIFPFGWQEYQEDFHFTGFRGETRLLGPERGLNIGMLERSGQDFRVCYALKSVENSSDEGWPWSIRQTATYHSFEADTGKMFWILVKGNELMKDRIQDATESAEPKRYQTRSTGSAFAATLETHLVVCDWALEKWRWYLNFLEKRLEDLTRHSLAISITKAPTTIAPRDIEKSRPSATKQRKCTWKSVLHVALATPPPNPPPLPGSSMHALHSDPLPLLGRHPSPPSPPSPSDTTWKLAQPVQPPSGETELSFHDLQEIQSMEDKLNMTVQVLISNTKILQELKDFYENLMELPEFPNEIKTTCHRDMARFSERIINMMKDLQMHKSRADTLLRLLADRKTLVCLPSHDAMTFSFYLVS